MPYYIMGINSGKKNQMTTTTTKKQDRSKNRGDI